jgi:hypothetical protein
LCHLTDSRQLRRWRAWGARPASARWERCRSRPGSGRASGVGCTAWFGSRGPRTVRAGGAGYHTHRLAGRVPYGHEPGGGTPQPCTVRTVLARPFLRRPNRQPSAAPLAAVANEPSSGTSAPWRSRPGRGRASGVGCTAWFGSRGTRTVRAGGAGYHTHRLAGRGPYGHETGGGTPQPCTVRTVLARPFLRLPNRQPSAAPLAAVANEPATGTEPPRRSRPGQGRASGVGCTAWFGSRGPRTVRAGGAGYHTHRLAGHVLYGHETGGGTPQPCTVRTVLARPFLRLPNAEPSAAPLAAVENEPAIGTEPPRRSRPGPGRASGVSLQGVVGVAR